MHTCVYIVGTHRHYIYIYIHDVNTHEVNMMAVCINIGIYIIFFNYIFKHVYLQYICIVKK